VGEIIHYALCPQQVLEARGRVVLAFGFSALGRLTECAVCTFLGLGTL
jgi:hypothetical protein